MAIRARRLLCVSLGPRRLRGCIVSRMKPRPIRTVWLLTIHFFALHGVAEGAGIARLDIPAASAEPRLNAIVWSPCARAPSDVQMGPFQMRGVSDCAVEGTELPLVVISHGHLGNLLGHRDTATALADAGFVVVSFNHPGDTFGDDGGAHELAIFESRPRDASRVISFMTTEWANRAQLDPESIGVFGFSRGGYTALALAGAKPSVPAAAERFCDAWWTFIIKLCRRIDDDGAQIRPVADPRVRAIVAADPLNLFDAGGLQSVRVPVQLWASQLGGDGVEMAHVEAVRTALPQPPEYRIAKGAGHFAYLAPCPAELVKDAAEICTDPEGFDRAAWHRSMNAAVVAFFRKTL
jgi:predicted dienelactone hydrolase